MRTIILALIGLLGSCLMLYSQTLSSALLESNSHFTRDDSNNKGIHLGERNKLNADLNMMSHGLCDDAPDTKTETVKALKAASASNTITVGNLIYSILSDKQVGVYDNTYGSDEMIPLLKIPSTITYSGKTYTVAIIGDYAFSCCDGLKSVSIPNSVTSIGSSAFWGCTALESVSIPSSVTSIDEDAFWGCTALQSVSIPSSVTSISSGMFRRCTALESVSIPSSVTSIGSSAFSGCTALQSVSIPSSVTSIGSSAFSGCTALQSVSIPSSVTSIGSSAFWRCTALQSVSIPSSVTSIGVGVFGYCLALESISVDESNSNYCSVDGVLYSKDKTQLIAFPGGRDGGFSVPETVRSIGAWAFAYCYNLANISLSNSITSIGAYAFIGCNILEHITLHNSITSIEEGAFYGCRKLKSVTLPDALTSLKDETFRECDSLDAIILPQSLCSIGIAVFSDCVGLKSIDIPHSVSSIEKHSFNRCYSLTAINVDASNANYCSADGVLYNKEKTQLLAYPSGKSGNFAFPESVNAIGLSAFNGAKNITKISIPNSVTSIEGYVFYGCENLDSISIPNFVTSIGDYAFANCTNLKAIFIPKKVATIGSAPFIGCNKLSYVYLPYTASSPSSVMSYKQLVNKFPETSTFRIPTDMYGTYSKYLSSERVELYRYEPFISYEGYEEIPNGDVILKGDTKQLICEMYPELMVVDDLTWESSDKNIATIDENGLISDHNCGDFDITLRVKAGDDIYTTTKRFKVRLATLEIGENLGRITRPATIPVVLNNRVPLTSFQCDISLPDEFEPVLNSAGNPVVKLNADRKSRTHSIVSSLQGENRVRVSVTSTTNANFIGDSGELFSLQVMPKTTKYGRHEVRMDSIIASDREMNRIIIENTGGYACLGAKPGDANIDEIVDVSDVSATVSYIHGRGANLFDFGSADVKEDNHIDVMDVTGIVNIILNSDLSLDSPFANTRSASSAPMFADEASTTGFYVKNEAFAQGKEATLQICYDKISNYSSFQTDIYLPEGVEILTYNEGDGDLPDVMLDADCDSGSHSIAAKIQKDGALRVVCNSMDNSLLNTSSGNVVFKVRIKPANDMQDKEYPVLFRYSVFDTDGHNAVRISENTSTIRIGNLNGLNDVHSEAFCGDADYYNLQGVRVAEPERGFVYIKVVNGVASKVMIK